MKPVFRWLLALLMVAVGILHFVDADSFAAIVPQALPAAYALVYISGVAEIAGGLGLLLPATRRAAAWGLIALYIAVFPANINTGRRSVEHWTGCRICCRTLGS